MGFLAVLSATGCLCSPWGETGVPAVEGFLLRDHQPLEGIRVTCRGRTGQLSTVTRADGGFSCPRQKTRLVPFFGDSGCRVSVRFELPEGRRLIYETGSPTVPCASNAREDVQCELTGTLAEDLEMDDYGPVPAAAPAHCTRPTGATLSSRPGQS